MTTRTGELRQVNRDRTTIAVEIGHLGQDNFTGELDRTARTGQSGQDSRERSA
jgi:hypothetical protein